MSDRPVRVMLHLPFCLRLLDGEYRVRHKDRTYMCNLRKVWSDFASGIDPDKHTGSVESELLFAVGAGKIAKASNIELRFDKNGFFRHTVFQTTAYMEENLKVEEIPNHVISILLPLINKMLKAYRHATGEFHVTEIQWQNLCMVRDGKLMPFMVMDYPVQGNQRSKSMGWFPGEDSPVVTVLPNFSKQHHKAIQKMLLEEDLKVPFERELVLNSKDFLNQGRYGLAVFELGTTLEIIVDNILLSKGLDEKKLKHLHFKDKYTSYLGKFAGISLEDNDGTLLQTILKIWNIRNNVAHRRLAAFTDNNGNVVERIESKEKVKPLMEATERLLDLLAAASKSYET